MKIAIVGLGAVGGYFGGKLAQTRHDIIFIARGKHLEAIRENGLYVESEQGDFLARPSLATDNPAEAGLVDLAILATKTWQVDEAAEQMKPMIGENTLILPLLNGVEAPYQLAKHFGEPRILGGFCRIQSQKMAYGRIQQGGANPMIAIGAIWDNAHRITMIANVLREAGITVQWPESILAEMWQKLLFVASFGGVGAVSRMNAGVMRTIPESRSLLQEAMAEIYEVAIAQNIPMRPTAMDEGMKTLDSLASTATASMQRDILNGLRSELEAQNGVVVRYGQALGVSTPVNRFIYYSLLPSEKLARSLS
jgi:2-dehydropantoate 2-reductase